MQKLIHYTTKVDSIHVLNLDKPDKTLCGQPTNSANYMEYDRHKNIDRSRKEQRHFCEACNLAIMAMVNRLLEESGP